MNQYKLELVIDWSQYYDGVYNGRFAQHGWTKNGGTPTADFIAADLQPNDSLDFKVYGINYTGPLFIRRMAVIFTKGGATATVTPGSTGPAAPAYSTPFVWNYGTTPNARQSLLGMVIYDFATPLALPFDSSIQPPPAGLTMLPTGAPQTLIIPTTLPGPVAFPSAATFAVTVCAEIWDGTNPQPWQATYTHDPDMDVTSD